MRPGDTATFDSRRFKSTVDDMRRRREEVHARGEEVFRRTGKLDPMVNVHGARRASRNAMVKDGTVAVLTNGIKLPIVSATDGTGSMGENVAKAFHGMGRMDAMLGGLRVRYQTDLSFAVMQDVDDHHPVYQMSQWESDNRAAEHIRLLLPDKDGGDATEDYDIGLWYLLNCTDVDIVRYGLKGYIFVVGDQIGRGYVTDSKISTHLGHAMQGERISTGDMCQALLKQWHVFYVQVGSGGGGYRNETTSWWHERLGQDRVVIVPEPDLLAEVQAGLLYVTETRNPTKDGLISFLKADGANKEVSDAEANQVWQWITEARVPFGEQVKLPGYGDIPMPGAKFAHYRHTWPIGHPRSGENVTPIDTDTPPALTDGKPKTGIDWSKF